MNHDWLDDNDDKWSDDPQCIMANELVDKWFSSSEWENLLEMSEMGCEVSLLLMREVSDQLCSLVFHLRNKSENTRIQYELKYFTDLMDHFGVAWN